MTTEQPVLVTVNADATAQLVIEGETTTLTGADVDQVRQQVLTHLAGEAARQGGQPLAVHVNDALTGSEFFTVDAQQTVTPYTPAPQISEPIDAAPATQAPAQELPSTRREARALTARDFAESKKPAPTGPAELGFRGGLNKATLGALKLAPGAHEKQIRASRKAIQRGIAGHKTIVVIGEKGGASKTTVTYLTSALLGRVRGGTILAWDNNEYKGTLGDRSYEATHDYTANDLLQHIDDFTEQSQSADLVNFVRSQGENKFDVLASQNKENNKKVIDAPAYKKLHKALSRFYRLIIVDTGNNSEAETWKAAVESADQLVLVTILKEDSARKLTSLADTLASQGHGDKLANAVTVISHASEINYPDIEQRLREHMGQLTRAVVSIPFDRSLDRGDVIEYDTLNKRVQEAWLHATATIMDGLKGGR